MNSYKIHRPKLGKPFITFFAAPNMGFKFTREKPWDFNGRWRYIARINQGEIWLSVDVGVGFEPNHMQLLKKIKSTLPEDDWDNIFQIAKSIVSN